jgi:hypothetical protein
VLEVGRYGFEETGAVRFGEFLRDNATLDLVSLSILLSEKKENERFYFFSGPRLDYLFHWIPVTVQEDNSTIHEVSPSMSFDRMTLAVVLGVGINFKFKETRTLSFETKYGWDLTNSTRTLAKSTRKNSLAFVLSVPFSSP